MSLFLEVTQAGMVGITLTVLVYLLCHRLAYNLRDVGITSAILLSVLMRYGLPTPPVSHALGITLLNGIFLTVLALIYSRPSRIPPIDLENQCGWRKWACNLFRNDCK